MQNYVLDELEIGKWMRVSAVADNILGAKLSEMGIVEGKEIKILFRAPFGCPIALDMGGHVLSLRKSEARLVQVQTI
jgi:ferrous iron transport protein A